MSTAAATPAEMAPEDLKAFIDARNKGEVPPKPVTPKSDPAPVAEEPKAASSRSQRRALRQAEERTTNLVLRVLQESGVVKKAEEPAAEVKEETEPKRADFPAGDEGTAQFLRATQKWDKAQESKQTTVQRDQTAQTEELKTFLAEMDAKAAEDVKGIKDWDAVQKAALADEEAPDFVPSEHPVLMGLLARSDMRAYVLYHFAKPANYEALESLLELSATPEKQIAAFHRLEGRLEKMYDADRSSVTEDTKAAQADPEKDKTASTPQKPEGRAEPQQEAKPAKPKPSSEVAARGGSPAPDEPAVGSAAWMLKRNQAQYGY